MIFLRDSLCLFAVSLSRQRHDILDFSYCLLSRVLHVTLANWQRFGSEFHLRSSSSAYSGFVNISRPAEYFTACYTVLKRPSKVETAVHGCNLASSLDSYRVVAPLSFPRSISLASLFTSLSIFGWSDLLQILHNVDRQHFRLLSFASLYLNLLVYDWSIFRSSSKISGNLQRPSIIFRNFWKMLATSVWPSEKFSRIFGNLQKVVRKLWKVVKYAIIRMSNNKRLNLS